MAKLEDKIKEFVDDDLTKDSLKISGVSLAEYAADVIISKQFSGKYAMVARGFLTLGSNAASYYLGKDAGEKNGSNQSNKPANP